MGERKVLNKYFAPDFDPYNMPRVKVRSCLCMARRHLRGQSARGPLLDRL